MRHRGRNTTMNLRDRLNPKHPVVGTDYRLMTGTELLVGTDETARVSLLLSPDGGEGWEPLSTAFPEAVGVTVTHATTRLGDMDASERVFRRHGAVECAFCHARVRVVDPHQRGCVDCITLRDTGLASAMNRGATGGDVPRLVEGMKARGAHYPGDNFYGLVHETAHGFDLELPDADPKAINVALMARTEYERLQAEVVAKTVARTVSAYYGAPLFPDGVRYAARSVKAFSEKDGVKVSWVPEDFVDETVRLHGSDRVREITAAVITTLRAMLGNK